MRAVAWLLAVAMALGATGCRKRAEPCVVTGVTVEEGPGPFQLQDGGLDREDLRRIATEAFARTPGFEVPTGEPGKGARRCRGLVSLVDARRAADGRSPAVEVLLRMDAIPADDADAVSETVRAAEQVAPGEPIAGAIRRAAQGGARRAASALALALEEARKPDADVIRDLEASDPRLRELAVGVLADRKNPAAVPGLVARLQDPDPDVADRAVGALAQIGDPRGVGPIIELSRRREGPFVAQMVRAVGDIGGVEAEAYLETMATGHPDPLVAEAAREALRDARRRRASGQTGPRTGGGAR
jgi:hypothetical protein